MLTLLLDSFSNDIYALRRLELEESEILTIVPSHLGPGRTRYHNARILFSREVGEELAEECAGFLEDGEIDRSNTNYLEWFEKRSQHMKVINQHAQLCATWAAERSNERKDQLDDSRRLRQEAIVDRLTALGWGTEIPFHIKQLNKHKSFKQPKELTERIWKNIETPLVEFLADLEQKRLASLRVKLIKERRLLAAKVYNGFVDSSPHEDILPPKVDMLSTEPFRTIIEDSPIYPEQKITEESFATALLSVPQFASSWKRRKDERLVEIMRKCNPEFTTEHLCLAKTFFRCSEYSNAEPISYPRILMHGSATYSSRWAYVTSDRESNSLQGTLKEEAWNADRKVRFHEEAERKAQFVVKACGLDPDVTTRAEMEDRNPALECLNCTGDSGRLFMRWDAAVHHNCAYPRGEALPPPSWKCLAVDEEDLFVTKEREVFEAGRPETGWIPVEDPDVHCCKACGNRRKMTRSRLRNHLWTKHNILDEVKFEHFEYHPDAAIDSRYPQAVRMNLLADGDSEEGDK
ncbi:F-box domain-containing protein [Favolaschia claudopus]|uniref:F-box domain-containing protein n=1 Tax=Favolaschia claudopus TaxID=2862362 RepID=A0AAW0DA21_9AGAR